MGKNIRLKVRGELIKARPSKKAKDELSKKVLAAVAVEYSQERLDALKPAIEANPEKYVEMAKNVLSKGELQEPQASFWNTISEFARNLMVHKSHGEKGGPLVSLLANTYNPSVAKGQFQTIKQALVANPNNAKALLPMFGGSEQAVSQLLHGTIYNPASFFGALEEANFDISKTITSEVLK